MVEHLDTLSAQAVFDAAPPVADMGLIAELQGTSLALSQIVQRVLSNFDERPALGWRRRIDHNQIAPEFSFLTYAVLNKQVQAVANFFANEPQFTQQSGERVCVLAFGSADYVVVDLALMLGGQVAVPLQTNASPIQLQEIFAEVEPKLIACSVEQLDLAVTLSLNQPTVEALLVFDIEPDLAGDAAKLLDAQDRLTQAARAVALCTLSEAIARGAAMPLAALFVPDAGENPVGAIFYTSGSTGSPKGAMYPISSVINFWRAARGTPQVHVSYQPLNHTYGRAWIYLALASGGCTCFTGKSDLSTLLADIRTVRPTNFAFVPRISELIFQRANALRHDDPDLTIDELRQKLLGGRMEAATTGSAPTAPELREFMEALLGFHLTEGYGTTETGAIAIDNVVQMPPITAYKLVDVPDLGYFSTDKPYPRGELAVRTPRLIYGYFGQDALNARLTDAEGYYHTGDIMAEIAPREIRYLDRRNNVLKLAQGEFIQIAKLESLYAGGDPAIRQIYIYGNSSRAYLLAVVVPNFDGLVHNLETSELKQQLLEALRRIAAANNLNGYEIPRDIIVETTPFSVENGLLAGVGKVLRPALKAQYEDKLESLYAELAARQDAELTALRSTTGSITPDEAVQRATASVLNLDEGSVSLDANFADLGGDSLSAVSLALLLEEVLGLAVDASSVMNPVASLRDLAQQITDARSGDADKGANFVDIHGADATTVRAADLTLDRFIDAETLRAAAALPTAENTTPHAVLLTGANGFLGRFLCLEYLERMEKSGGTLFCVARGRDDKDAAARLARAFDSGDAALLERFDTLAARHLTVLAGDLSAPHLGLSQENWDRLAHAIDLIVHPAALVNHKLAYKQMFKPNVAGTAELIALALTTRKKRFINISTIAASPQRRVPEDADIRSTMPEWPLSDAYANGYAASKWAGEVLLRQAHQDYSLPICNFRSNMILAHRRFGGQLNLPDVFTRWVLSIAQTGIAPVSFYNKTGGHYEGLPVDFIAEAIAAIGEARQRDFNNFHVLNPHDDGISMDNFVDWIDDAGFPINRLPDFDAWRARFETALNSLPEHARAKSSLAVIEMFNQPASAVAGSDSSTDCFIAAVAETRCGDGGNIPHLDAALIRKYLADLRGLGALAMPTN